MDRVLSASEQLHKELDKTKKEVHGSGDHEKDE
jgi:hypothetical protein